ncbi:MAG TPA: (2Fe-2S)-binding protein [Myxococcota bacterium]|nr:(2Fe-2S)-binding protein [Myxococcota bacterium]
MARLVCRCMGLSSRRIAALARERGIGDVEALAEACGAGGGCGTCRPELLEILADVAGAPVLESVRRANRARNASETQRRVESALFGSIAARLPAGAQVELVSVDGLRVELHAAGAPEAELHTLVAERLRKLVCAELEVVFA